VLTTKFDILEKSECPVCQIGTSGFYSAKIVNISKWRHFIHFISWTMQAYFLGYAHVSLTIWLNFTQETKKHFKL
jgi:hypothetical protein